MYVCGCERIDGRFFHNIAALKCLFKPVPLWEEYLYAAAVLRRETPGGSCTSIGGAALSTL